MSEIWMNLANESASDREPGYAAYARKQAATYWALQEDVMEHWSKWEEVKQKLGDRKTKSRKHGVTEKVKQMSVRGSMADADENSGSGGSVDNNNNGDNNDNDNEGWLDLENYARGCLEDEADVTDGT
ncbi:hypothetical protein Moror_15894 [Moniliophthora roreri MCA 2997]|uniref:Uncharacterized protein n=1 Tax=Moniliophthora roreri (strain MCA 2997) TaxID=1381753 RepID=V2XGE4_MONRO|nr:hypothetical protein Moror_15894 [Moniliophthora roreri MCA 2997]